LADPVPSLSQTNASVDLFPSRNVNILSWVGSAAQLALD
jgi:hypothetical protein